jgi:hypothetical protein
MVVTIFVTYIPVVWTFEKDGFKFSLLCISGYEWVVVEHDGKVGFRQSKDDGKPVGCENEDVEE